MFLFCYCLFIPVTTSVLLVNSMQFFKSISVQKDAKITDSTRFFFCFTITFFLIFCQVFFIRLIHFLFSCYYRRNRVQSRLEIFSASNCNSLSCCITAMVTFSLIFFFAVHMKLFSYIHYQIHNFAGIIELTIDQAIYQYISPALLSHTVGQ